MKIIKMLFICSIFVLLHANMSFALENSNNSGELNERTIKNFTYLMDYSGETVTLKNGEYKTPLRPGNKEDMSRYIHVKVEKYVIGTSFIRNQPVAIVVLSENSGGSGTFFQITALIKEKDKIIQTNSIMLGDRVVIKNLSFQRGYRTFRESERDTIFLSILTHKATDPNCCPSKLENKCFNLVYDENLNKIKLLTCEEAEKEYPLPVVKKPAIYLYPEKSQKIKILLKSKGSLTKTIPEYHDKWIVTANPDGLINGKYPYLFYEVELTEQVKLPEQGWIVPKNDIEKWFDEYLPKLGLNNKEIKDFKDYWLAQLKQYPYYKIKILDGDFVNENLKIQIKPEPETIIRVILYFEGTYNDLEKVANPVIETPIRKGFTVVEWGGILKDSDKAKEIKQEQVQKEEKKSIVEVIKNAVVEIKKDIKNATIYAINQEIKRYENRGETEKVKQLKKDLEEIQKFKDEDFPVPENLENGSSDSLLNEKTFGSIIPCKAKEVEIIVDKKYSLGDILNVKGMTRSGFLSHSGHTRCN